MRDIGGPGLVARKIRLEAYGELSSIEDIGERCAAFIRWSVGPCLAGIQPASLLRIPSLFRFYWAGKADALCREFHLSAKHMRRGERIELVLFYRSRRLAHAILRGNTSRYLLRTGYPVESGLEACLERLGSLIEEADGFPHEVGIFLGYPLADVIGFISGSYTPCGCRGYWKVFQRPEKAERTFARMDAARVAALRNHAPPFHGQKRVEIRVIKSNPLGKANKG